MVDDAEARDSWHAALKLAKSTHVRRLIKTVVTMVLIPAAAAAVSWVTAKLDTKLQLDTLTKQVTELEKADLAVRKRQGDLELAIINLTAPVTDNFSGGPITQLRTDVRYAFREHVRCRVLATAYEKERERQRRNAKAQEFMRVFDKYTLTDGDRPRDAVGKVFTEIALP